MTPPEPPNRRRNAADRPRSAEHYRDLVERIDRGFCVFEMLYGADGHPRDYRFLEANPAFERHTGLVGAVGKTARALVPGLEDHWVEVYGRVAETGESYRFEQGSAAMGRWFEVDAVRVGGEESRRVALLFTDVSARKQAEVALRAAEEERQRLLDSVAHDLKNPLAAIKGQAQLLRRQLAGRVAPDVATVAERIAGFEGMADRMAEMVDELDDHARLAGDRPFELDVERTDLEALVRDAVAEVRVRQAAAPHAVCLEVEGNDLVGVWDGRRLRRVVANLLDNAVKYSPDGGSVRVHLTRADGAAVLRIRDEGIGIPIVDLPHVFDFRRRGGNVGAIAGSGIGLAGAKRIVEQHGGTITAESEEGRGATVTVRLPLASDPARS